MSRQNSAQQIYKVSSVSDVAHRQATAAHRRLTPITPQRETTQVASREN